MLQIFAKRWVLPLTQPVRFHSEAVKKAFDELYLVYNLNLIHAGLGIAFPCKSLCVKW